MYRRWLVPLLCGLVLLAGLAATAFTGRAAASGEGQGRVVEIEMEARQWEYGPGTIEVNQGDRVRITLMSMDVAHGFYLDGYDINQYADPGKSVVIEFTADKAGRWMYRCSTTCGSFHPYMIGWLRVKPNWYAGAGWALSAMAGLGFTGYLIAQGVRKE
ncbi:MAG: cupredoxin domain-containing protein [Bacillota bacterium]